jgi:general nucleoside transport system permease protein
MSEQPPASNPPDPPREPEGPAVPLGPEPVAPESVAPDSAGPEFAGPEPEEALAEVAASSPPNPEEPESPPGQEEAAGGRARLVLNSIMEGNAFIVTILALVVALVVGGLINAFSNSTVLHAWGNFFSAPGHAIALAWDTAIGAYVALFEGSIFNPHTVSALFQQASISTAIHDGYLSAVFNPLSETCVAATPLILAGLAVALPYQAGLFNIGGQSQFIGGAIVATYLGYGVSLPPVIHVIVCVLGGFAGGAALGWLVGELKARTGAHEVITTIMLNYIMAYFLSYLLSYHYLIQAPGTVNPITLPIASDAHLPQLFGTHLRINAGFLIALACAAGIWWLLERTTVGFEFRSVGKNPSAARVAGMNVERNWVLVMLIAGGLAGVAASTVIQGTDFTLNDQSFGQYGIVGITVALLGRGRPGGVVVAGLLFGAFSAGAPLMQAQSGTPVDMVYVLEAIIVLFVAAPPLIRAIFRLRGGGGGLQVLARGWGA